MHVVQTSASKARYHGALEAAASKQAQDVRKRFSTLLPHEDMRVRVNSPPASLALGIPREPPAKAAISVARDIQKPTSSETLRPRITAESPGLAFFEPDITRAA